MATNKGMPGSCEEVFSFTGGWASQEVCLHGSCEKVFLHGR